MNGDRALEDLETALARWLKAKETIRAGWRTEADLRDRERRLMELDDAITTAQDFCSYPGMKDALEKVRLAMMGRNAA